MADHVAEALEWPPSGLWPVRLEMAEALERLSIAIQHWTAETSRLQERAERLTHHMRAMSQSHAHVAKNARMLLKAVKGMAAWRHEFYQEPSVELKAAEAQCWELLRELEAGLRLLDNGTEP